MPGTGTSEPSHGWRRILDRAGKPWVQARWLVVLLVAIPVLIAAGCTVFLNSGADRKPDSEFVTAYGRGLFVNGEPTRLKAVNFSNFYHRTFNGMELLDSQHHSAADFARAREMGFNSVRFAFDGDWYADSPDFFFQWLDRNVAWAKEHDMRLVLDLHTPIGGFWLDRTSDAVSFDLWSSAELQQRNIDLWRDVAGRYKDEKAIAAYDLLNEPVTTDATGEQWQRLAGDMVAAVRAVDPNHLLVMGGIYGVNGHYGTTGIDRHFLVDDDNVVYDFHFYEPMEYTHQYASWIGGPLKDGGRYPDPNVVIPTGDRVLLPENRIATSSLPPGTSDWAPYDSGVIPIDNGQATAAAPMVTVQGGMKGTVRFDAIVVTEYGPDGAEIRKVTEALLDGDGTRDWHEWQYGGDGGATAAFAREAAGYQDNGSLSITNVAAGATAGWSSDEHLFKVVPGNKYRIQGYMQGQDIAPVAGPAPRISLQLDVYAGTPGAAGNGFVELGKEYLAYELAKHLDFGADHNVPMSVMEFGLVRQAFEIEGKGGDRWVADVLSLLEDNDLSFGYWQYHNDHMGLYLTGTGPPGEPNRLLQDTLTRELR